MIITKNYSGTINYNRLNICFRNDIKLKKYLTLKKFIYSRTGFHDSDKYLGKAENGTDIV